MLRLFASLYLVIILGILTINIGSEYLWQKLNTNQQTTKINASYDIENHNLALTKQLTQLIPHLLKKHSPNEIGQIFSESTTNKLNITIENKTDISWLPDQLQQLATGKVVDVYDLNQDLFLYVAAQQTGKVIKVGPIKLQPIEQPSVFIFTIVSYGLLAIVIFLWTRPIWRDLQQLTFLAEQINHHHLPLSNTVSAHSPVKPIVESINSMAAKIKQLLSEQKHLINAVSHELRTPLSRVRFAFAMLPQIPIQQQQEIEQDLSEIEQLIDEMLNYSRIEYIQGEYTKSVININELLSNQITKHQRSAKITLQLNIPHKILFNANGELLERACQNLITNAIKYAASQVIISANLFQDTLTITVEDDGCGIAEQDKVKLFEPFTRVDKSRNKANGGHGLGLAIVQKSCFWHQGICKIEESELGGAKFIIQLPNTS